MTPVPAVSAVVVSWNAGSSLATCLDSLRESATRADVELQVVLVDNASSDGAVAALALGAGDVVVGNPVNAGYGVAATQGLARAGAPWALLVNPDLVVDAAFFGELMRAADGAAPDVGTLVPELRYAFDRDLVNCRGVALDEIGAPAEIDAGRPAADAPHPREVLGGSSGCCLLRRSAVAALGGPEPAFFAYLEDVDLAYRLQRAGYRATFVPAAVAWHEGSASTGAQSPLKTFLVARNRRLLFRLDGPRTPRARAWRAVVELGHGLVSSRSGAALAPWRGRLDAVRLRRYTAFVRRSRALLEPERRDPPLAPRATLRETLRRKRAADAATARH